MIDNHKFLSLNDITKVIVDYEANHTKVCKVKSVHLDAILVILPGSNISSPTIPGSYLHECGETHEHGMNQHLLYQHLLLFQTKI